MKINALDHPNCFVGMKYAEDVRDNPLNYCVKIGYAVQRFFKDIERVEKDETCPYTIDIDKAERFLKLVQQFEHVKGANWKSKCILYEPWQKFAFLNLFMFYRKETNRRRFRNAAFFWPRGNAKSAVASQVGLYFLSLDGEVGPEVVCASTKKDAARIVFDSAKAMAEKNKSFLKNTKTRPLAHTLLHPPSNGVMKPLSSDAKSQDGLNPSLILGDEIHEWTRALYDVLDSSMTKRDDSLFVMISTAGFNTEGIGHEIFAYTVRVLKGEVEDDTWYGNIYDAEEEKENWEDVEVWKRANPNWGISVDPINFEAKAKKAVQTPASKNNFLVKHLNIWTNQASPYFDLESWDACAVEGLTLDSMGGERCFMSMDLATKIDLCPYVFLFRSKDKETEKFIYTLIDKSYLPEKRLEDERNTSYRRWVDEGWLIKHEGAVIDYEKLEADIHNDYKQHKVNSLMYDPWNATATAQSLEKKRVDLTEYKMTTGNLSEPMKQLDAVIRSKQIRHNGSPLLRWCLSNVVAKEDPNGNVFPRKDHDRLKIDPIVAAIMAMGGWINEEQNTSVYEERGVRFI